MKLFIKLIIFILVLGLTAPFILKRPDGSPWMSLESVLPDFYALFRQGKGTLDKAIDKTKSKAPTSTKTKVHKWRDKNGVWQYSDTPNPNGNSEEMWVDPNTNLVKGTPISASEPAPKSQQTKNNSPNIPVPITVSPDKVSKLMDDAKKIQDLMDQRTQDLEGL